MKIIALFASLLVSSALLGQENDTSVHFSPREGGIKTNQTFTLVFPDAVVPAEAVGRAGESSPLVFTPKLSGEFYWRSQTEGSFTVTSPVVPGMKYEVALRKNLKLLDGKALPKGAVAGTYESAPLAVTPKFRNWGSRLPAVPSIRLLFNYKIEYAAAAKAIYFQDRDSRERFAAAVLIPGITTKEDEPSPEAPKSGSDLTVEPENPLPVGRKIDLIVEGLRDADTGTPIPFLKTYPLGETTPLSVRGVTAFGSALEEPAIHIDFSGSVNIDMVGESTIAVTPAVPNLRRETGGSRVSLKGDFDLRADYTVTVTPPLLATTSYGLAAPYAKTVTFGGYNPEIWFPSQMFFQRSSLGLNVKFLHANTKSVTWKLAPIPDHQIAIVSGRLGSGKELILDSLGLQPVGSGDLPGTSTTEAVFRDITWKSAADQPMLSGAYLLEVSTPLRSGKLAGHRAMIFFNDLYVTQKRTSDEVIFKLSRMADAMPVAGASVRVVRADNELLAKAQSDADGIARFAESAVFPPRQEGAHHLLIDSPNGRAIQFVSVPRFSNSGWASSSGTTTLRGEIITDRNLYRPGSSVKFKGIARRYDAREMPSPPADQQVMWSIRESQNNKIVASGETRTDAFGGWEGEWLTSASQSLGGYAVSAEISGLGNAGYGWFQVEEYRTPLFSVDVKDASKPGAEATRIAVQSNYFHGAPNAGARVQWNVSWSTDDGVPWDGFRRTDAYSENPLPEPVPESQSGELRLDANGSGVIELPLPVGKPLYQAGLSYGFTVDVTSPEGRTITSGVYASRAVIPLVPGIQAEPVYPEGASPAVEITLKAINAVDKKDAPDQSMTVELYHVTSQTVKEKIAPGVYRFRNFERFEISAIEKTVSGKAIRLPAPHPGRYVAVSYLDGQPDAPKVSARVTVADDAPAQYPVETSTTFALKPDKEDYLVGETAVLASESPFAGKAWVSVETRGIVDQFVVDVPANASRIDLPIKPTYFPNVYVTVYLVQPGGADHLPVERFGRTHLVIRRPDLYLKVEPSLAQEEVEPGKPVSGTVLVSCEGKPRADADVTIMVVDEAVLRLGDWQMPDLLGAFFPFRGHGVSTYQALHNHFESFDESDMVEKGFLIGGGGEGGMNQQQLRKNFLARAYWKTQLRTDAQGMVAFDFAAPDNLTAFRVTAVAQTRESQFGHGRTTLRVAKRLMAEPALPRFVRHGDVVELRVVVRQTAVDSGMALVRCETSGGIELLGKGAADPTELRDGLPQVFRFPAKVTSYEPAVVRFRASLDGRSDIGDAVETTLPVHEPGILQATGRFGEIPAGANGFKLSEHVPDFWQKTSGSFGLTLSYNPWLPKLTGLPTILDYPHGCLEQKSSRYLAYTVLADLLAYLPDLQGRHANYAQRITEGLRLFESSLIEGKFLPYWPGSQGRNLYVTVLAAWVTENARKAGIEVPDKLTKAFAAGLDDIIRGRTNASMDIRCFALFVLGESGRKDASHADVLRDLYLHRDRMSDEGRSLLAIAMHSLGVLPDEMAQLIRETSQPLEARAFDPNTFYSTDRAQAMRFVAHSRVGGEAWEKGAAAEARERLLKMMDSSFNLSTQENLWLLIAFKELHDRQEFAAFDPAKIQPVAEQISENKASVAWKQRGLEKLNEMVVAFENSEPAYYLVDAQVMRTADNARREDRGIRIERVVHNLTDKKRLGTEKAPFKLGDEVLVSYRMSVQNIQHFTALVDELPGALETMNPNLAQVAEFYQIPDEFASSSLWLDHSELRDRSANLYFDRVEPGQHSYSIVARVTSVGRFTWPSATMTPMYETRFGGLTAPNDCYVIE